MSTELFSHNGITVAKYAGPELPFGGDRRRYQIVVDEGRLITISRQQWETLAEFITADCGPECESPRLDQPLPENWRWTVDEHPRR